jgi:hypothetical protein
MKGGRFSMEEMTGVKWIIVQRVGQTTPLAEVSPPPIESLFQRANPQRKFRSVLPARQAGKGALKPRSTP